MKIVAAVDSFKGSIDSLSAGNAVREGVLLAIPNADVIVKEVADGGEGTFEVLTRSLGGSFVDVNVHGPLGFIAPLIKARYGIIEDRNLAVIEMAQAAGLPLLEVNERNPLNTTTWGVGEMILDALNRGIRNFIIGIGGSSTNDCGIGMLSALGFKFVSIDGRITGLYGRDLSQIKYIDASNVNPLLKDACFTVACDVTNPLYGPDGCSYVYARQKGASPEIVELMDDWISKFANITKGKYNDADPSYPGSGAAGGLGFAFKYFLNSSLESGINIVTNITKLGQEIETADYVVVGEGSIDSQSLNGKVISGIAKIALQNNTKVVAIGGMVKGNPEDYHSIGIEDVLPIHEEGLTLEQMMDSKQTISDIIRTIENYFREKQIK